MKNQKSQKKTENIAKYNQVVRGKQTKIYEIVRLYIE